MNGPPQLIAAELGEPHEEYCTVCRAYTLVCTPLYLITPHGVTLTQHLALCSVHESGEFDEERRRIPPR